MVSALALPGGGIIPGFDMPPMPGGPGGGPIIPGPGVAAGIAPVRGVNASI
jgi:hypothetical protein